LETQRKLANKIPGENQSRQTFEIICLDGLEEPGLDSRFARDVIDRQTAINAFLSKFRANSK
jgi:hypothetical protein